MTARNLRLAAVLLVTLASLAWALWGIEIDKVADAVRAVRWPLVVPVVAAIVVGFLARVARFQLLLGDARPPHRRQIVVCAIGFLAINVVPLRLGELVRPFMLLEDDVTWGRSIGAVVMERVVDLCMLLAMLSLVSFAVDLPSTIVVRGIDVLAAGQQAVGVALAVLIAGLLGVVVGGEPVLGALAHLPVLGPRVAAFGGSFRDGLAHLFRRPLEAAAVFALGALVWASTVAGAYSLLLAMPGLPAGPDVALAVTAVTVAGTVAVPTPGFFGPFEVFCKATLVLWSVEPSVAAAFAVLWHALIFGFHVLSGAALLGREGLSLGALVRGSREAVTRD
ncbi:MAG: flippase-like domain-containing protein [Myxococcales bacterium]|nr:flippase-like domain-containing protein [Myxococcales bacterium]